jgi:Rap1a immunity proteins
MTRALALAPALAMLAAGAFGKDAGYFGTFVRSEQLFSMCIDKNTAESDAECLAYVVGVIDGLSSMDLDTNSKWGACLPVEVTTGDVQATVRRFLRTYPEVRGEVLSGARLVKLALMTEYPCKAD